MGDFIVSARKYRPSTFASVVGQDNIATTLKNAVLQNQVAQAFLFCGPRGVGKTTCARILAKTINCTHRTSEGEACNECESCRSFNESASFNIFELDAASNNSVDDIRSLVEQVRIPPQGAKYKVYIIDEVHMLSQAAFNAFLKTLEEPPAYAKFILATTEKHKILPTILSRCQVFDFKRIQTEDITRHLMYVAAQEGVKYEEEALRVIAQKADGGLRDALSIFDQSVIYTSGDITYKKVIENLNVLDFEYYLKMTEFLHEGNIPQVLLTFNEIIEKGFDGQHFLDGMCEHLRNLMVCRTPETIRLLEAGEAVRRQYTEQVQRIPAAFLLQCLDMFSKCNASYKTSNNRRLHVELALMLCCRLKNPTTPPSTGTPQTPSAPQQNHPSPTPHPQHMSGTLSSAKPDTAEVPKQSRNMGTTSIKDLMSTVRNEHKVLTDTATKEETTETAAVTAIPAMDADTAAYKLKSQWTDIVKTHCSHNLAAVSLLMEKEKVEIKNDCITFKISNDVAERNIRDTLAALKPALYEMTGISYRFAFIMEETEHAVRIINPEEKFRKLCELNPELKYLKETLGLAIS